MGQVPKKYGIVGDGKVATHISRYLNLKDIPFKIWTRNSSKTPNAAFIDCEFILVLIKDSEIISFINSNPKLKREKRLVHFSGSLTTPLAHGIHPLFSFSERYYELNTYESIPFITEIGGLTFDKVFPDLNNPTFQINPDLKNLYHSLCVLSANFTTILWQKTINDFEKKFNLNKSVLLPLMESVFDNIRKDHENALTGPLERRDYKTIHNNLLSLKTDPYQLVYKAFTKIHTPEFFDDRIDE